MSDTLLQEEVTAKRETQRIWCNRCGGTTIHELKYAHPGCNGDPSEDQYFEEWTDSLWACCGCESAVLIHHWRMAGAETEPNAPQPEVLVYPPSTSGQKQSKHFVRLPTQLTKLYREVVGALNSGSMVLCTIGLRALLEGICTDRGLKGSDLEKKIDKLLQFIPNSSLIDSLHGFRFAGNEAAHDLTAMYPSEASDAVEVMEDLLNFLYELDYKASQLKHASLQQKRRQQQLKPKP